MAEGVMVSLTDIYKQVQHTDRKVDQLATSVEQMVAINARLDSHRDRLERQESDIALLKRKDAVRDATHRPRAPWYSVIAGVVGIITGLGVLVSLVKIAGELASM